ncbi:MAG: type VI secretion system membrane subunit TssM [Rhodospirillaceae bacterium]|nr:type VI secretion system membrane subunit TssM [Rhodospirillaceae bacterium]
MLKKVLSIFISRWFWTLIGALILCALIWFFGQAVAFGDWHPWASDLAKLITIVVILVLWGLVNLFTRMREGQTNRRMVKELSEEERQAAKARAEVDQSATEEVEVLRRRLLEALNLLRSARLGGRTGGRYLYQLPWYILIGPPGSGKTTALVNSGLKFPLADRLGRQAVRGVGGTRNCDWWFTNDAVLIDTAGRYTTQDSQEEVDSAAWTGFLDLLKKYRPRQPINGALIAISLADLAVGTEAERLAHARSIRQRLRELHDKLGVRLPVYVLLTKTDLAAGFVEFFDELSREEREQVWGMTFPLDEGGDDEGVVVEFGREFDLLMEQMQGRLLERLQQEPDIRRRSQIFGFPAQMASMKGVIADFLTEVFQPSRFERRPLLRGVYFTSGTQIGTPIDRFVAAMATSFGLDREQTPPLSGHGRSFFLTRLLRSVVFAEANVVGVDQRVERKRRWRQRGVLAAAAMVLLLVAGAWFYSYTQNRELIARADAAADAYEADLSGVELTNIDEADFERILAPLNDLRALPGGYADRIAGGPPIGMTLGLYQGDKIGAPAIGVYHRALDVMLLPRVLIRLEQQIEQTTTLLEQEADNTSDRARQLFQALYQALKVYLVLGNQGPSDLDRQFVVDWMAADWQTTFPGTRNAVGRDALERHLDTLINPLLWQAALPNIGLDDDLIEDARRQLALQPLGARAYAILRGSQAARSLPEWRIIDAGGPATQQVFQRRSGLPLSDGVPGFWTYDGFHQVLLPHVLEVSEEIASDSWVLGGPVEVDDRQLGLLQRDVTALYLDEYAQRWEGILADIAVVPFRNLEHATEVLNILSGANSPLKNLLSSIATETTLTATPDTGPTAQDAVDGAGTAQQLVRSPALARADRIARIAAGAASGDGGPPPPPPGQFIDDRFAQLHAFVKGADGQPPPLDDLITSLGRVYTQLNRATMSGDQGGVLLSAISGTDNDATQELLSQAARLPDPVNEMVASVARAAAAITVGGARGQLDALWQSQVVPVCRTAVENRYPVYADSITDMTLDDFKRMFGPGGLLDSFFKDNLESFVNTLPTPWQWREVQNVSLSLPNDVLAQFERAAHIRDAFFGADGNISVGFSVIPVELDDRATQVVLDVDGQQVAYQHGPTQLSLTPMTWPGTVTPNQSRITFSPAGSGPSSASVQGPWAWFRMLDQAVIDRGVPGTDRFNFTLVVGGRSATFQLRPNSVVNPFGLDDLSQFRCPESL